MHTLTEAEFDDAVLAATEPVLVDFWAEWCPPCKAMDPVLADLAVELAGRVKIVKVDVEATPGLAVRFNVRSMPTMIVFKNGMPADMKVGAGQSRVGLTKWLESYAA